MSYLRQRIQHATCARAIENKHVQVVVDQARVEMDRSCRAKVLQRFYNGNLRPSITRRHLRGGHEGDRLVVPGTARERYLQAAAQQVEGDPGPIVRKMSDVCNNSKKAYHLG